MLYLILAILSSFGIAVLVKVNETKDLNRQVVIASNYIVGATLGWTFLLWDGLSSISWPTWALGFGGGSTVAQYILHSDVWHPLSC
jgi:hypothetical protein